jgi:hypothetical protein
MQQYNMLQAIFMSFYSKKLYRDVAINWGGKTFLYLLLILTLSWIYATYKTQIFLKTGFEYLSDEIVTQIPVMTIKDGKLSTPENRPYLITNPNTHEKIAIIDTSGKYKDLEQTNGVLLVTQTEVISQSDPHEIRKNEIPTNLNFTIVPETIKKKVKDYLDFAWIFIFIGAVITSYVYRLIQVFLYSIIGKIFAVISDSKVTYGQIIQITMVAITPVIIINTILSAMGIWIHYELLLYFVLAILFMFYGIIANRNWQ